MDENMSLSAGGHSQVLSLAESRDERLLDVADVWMWRCGDGLTGVFDDGRLEFQRDKLFDVSLASTKTKKIQQNIGLFVFLYCLFWRTSQVTPSLIVGAWPKNVHRETRYVWMKGIILNPD